MPAQPPERPGCPKAPGGRRPLPDPAAVRLYLVPDPAPPYDAEPFAGDPGCGRLLAWAPAGGRPGPWNRDTGNRDTGNRGTGNRGTGDQDTPNQGTRNQGTGI